MNSFELNKIFGAILGVLVFVMGVGFIADAIYAPIENRGATYELPEPEGGEGGETEVAAFQPIAVRMQTATAEAGERLIIRCQSCHDYSPANANRTGPGIYDIVGNEIAHHEGFNYSDALPDAWRCRRNLGLRASGRLPRLRRAIMRPARDDALLACPIPTIAPI